MKPLNKKEEKPYFYLVYITKEDEKMEIEKQISELTEEQKSELLFNGDQLYVLGIGHSFSEGFFTEFITKSGIKAYCFDSGVWKIDGKLYNYVDSKFIKIPEIVRNINSIEPIDFSTFSFPIIKNVNAKLLADDLCKIY
jgi:hypothetical protein